MRVLMAQPRGFCAGVVRAIEIVERSLEKFGAPVYVRHEIVHNRHVVEKLERMGAVFVEALDEIPDGAVTIFSAHAWPSRSSTRRSRAACRCSTLRAHWSRRCTSRASDTWRAAGH